jgi:hypothetical protein
MDLGGAIALLIWGMHMVQARLRRVAAGDATGQADHPSYPERSNARSAESSREPPSSVLEVGPGALALFLAGDVVVESLIGHAGAIARAFQVPADRIALYYDGCDAGIIVDLHIAADVIPGHCGAEAGDGVGRIVVLHLQIASDRASRSYARGGIVVAAEISADRDGAEIAAGIRTAPNLDIASDGHRAPFPRFKVNQMPFHRFNRTFHR